MTNVTFSVDDDIHKKMREHPEIKWTEILRQSIIDYLKKVEENDVLLMGEFRNRLDQDTLNMIEELDEEEEIKFYKKTKKLEKDRSKSLLEIERG